MTTSEFIKTVSFHALGWGVSAEATYDLAMLALQRGIPGDFVECGVYAGASSALMARALMDWEFGQQHEITDRDRWAMTEFKTRRVHLFDSFQGMPAAEPVDEEQYREHGTQTGMAAVPLEQVKENMRRWRIPDELLVYHPGWFKDTVEIAVCGGWPDGYNLTQIAVLRLDGDLYSSTSIAMKHLYPLVSPGGWVIVDDYHLSGCKKAVHEVVNPGPVYWRKI